MEAIRPSSFGGANRDIIRVLLTPSASYFALLALVTAMLWGGYCWYLQITWGMGVAGITHPTMWGVYIVTFVFWIGIGHAGTLISAILFLVRSRWRTGVYRASEAMTVFAVMTALLFPVLHLGRAWQAYWFFPYPNQRQLWMNFKSPLMWDVFAISTYFTVSAVFFYIGLVPDIAIFRDHSKGLVKKVYSLLLGGVVPQSVAPLHGCLLLRGLRGSPRSLSSTASFLGTSRWRHSWLALDHLPALLRRGRTFWMRDGYTADADDVHLQMGRVRQHLALRELG